MYISLTLQFGISLGISTVTCLKVNSWYLTSPFLSLPHFSKWSHHSPKSINLGIPQSLLFPFIPYIQTITKSCWPELQNTYKIVLVSASHHLTSSCHHPSCWMFATVSYLVPLLLLSLCYGLFSQTLRNSFQTVNLIALLLCFRPSHIFSEQVFRIRMKSGSLTQAHKEGLISALPASPTSSPMIRPAVHDTSATPASSIFL